MSEPDFRDTATDEQLPAVPIRYVYSPVFADVLRQNRLALLVSTYQAGRLMAIRAGNAGLTALLRSFPRAMGLAVGEGEIATGTRNAVWFFRDAPDIAATLDPPGTYDACYLPRRCHITGDIRCHEMAFCRDGLWIVNTRFNCLCSLGEQYSFVPRWRPPFVTDPGAGDRCHMSGLCAVDGEPRYVTAHAAVSEIEGWRSLKLGGGVIVDVRTSQVISDGLCMPHSPRWHAGRLWVLNSGLGELQAVDCATGRRETVIRLPGYARGLAFHGGLAFIALSTIREKREFGGVPVEQHAGLRCAIHAVDIQAGRSLGVLTFESGCTEIFDLQLLSGRCRPQILGIQKDSIDDLFVIP